MKRQQNGPSTSLSLTQTSAAYATFSARIVVNSESYLSGCLRRFSRCASRKSSFPRPLFHPDPLSRARLISLDKSCRISCDHTEGREAAGHDRVRAHNAISAQCEFALCAKDDGIVSQPTVAPDGDPATGCRALRMNGKTYV